MDPQKTTPEPKRLKRSPTGCNAKPLYISLMPSERTEIERIAAKNHHTESAIGRELLLLGLKAFKRKYRNGLLPSAEA